MKHLIYVFALVASIKAITAVVPAKTQNATVIDTGPDSVEAREKSKAMEVVPPTSTPAAATTTTTIAVPDKPTEPPLDLSYTFPYYSRAEWGARKPNEVKPLNLTQVPYIVIHDSGEPPMIDIAGCFNVTQCSKSMKNIQNEHMDINGWSDIGYHFAIGGDGAVYEGRGWGTLGAHLKYFNSVSLGICFIGSYAGKLTPTLVQTTALDDLIAAGTRGGLIRADYRLITHGQIKATLCPGKKLAKKVLTLAHYSTFPGSLKDLLDIPEISDYDKDKIKQELASLSDAI